MATHSNILAWTSPWGCKESEKTEWLSLHSLNGLVIFPTFFNLSLNFAIRSSWSEPQSAPGLVFADYIQLFHLGLQRIFCKINMILVLTIWWYPCVESSPVLLEEGVCYDQCVLLAKLSFCPASFCTPRPNLPVTPGSSTVIIHTKTWLLSCLKT